MDSNKNFFPVNFPKLVGAKLVFRKFHRKTAVLEFLFNKAEDPQFCGFIKKDFNTRISYAICEIFKNNFFYSTPRVAAF